MNILKIGTSDLDATNRKTPYTLLAFGDGQDNKMLCLQVDSTNDTSEIESKVTSYNQVARQMGRGMYLSKNVS